MRPVFPFAAPLNFKGTGELSGFGERKASLGGLMRRPPSIEIPEPDMPGGEKIEHALQVFTTALSPSFRPLSTGVGSLQGSPTGGSPHSVSFSTLRSTNSEDGRPNSPMTALVGKTMQAVVDDLVAAEFLRWKWVPPHEAEHLPATAVPPSKVVQLLRIFTGSRALTCDQVGTGG
jgi:hypothetical protein